MGRGADIAVIYDSANNEVFVRRGDDVVFRYDFTKPFNERVKVFIRGDWIAVIEKLAARAEEMERKAEVEKALAEIEAEARRYGLTLEELEKMVRVVE